MNIKGSEKQIKWAEDIRKRALNAIERKRTWFKKADDEGHLDCKIEIESCDETREMLERWFNMCTHASQIIARKNYLSEDGVWSIIRGKTIEKGCRRY